MTEVMTEVTKDRPGSVLRECGRKGTVRRVKVALRRMKELEEFLQEEEGACVETLTIAYRSASILSHSLAPPPVTCTASSPGCRSSLFAARILLPLHQHHHTHHHRRGLLQSSASSFPLPLFEHLHSVHFSLLDARPSCLVRVCLRNPSHLFFPGSSSQLGSSEVACIATVHMARKLACNATSRFMGARHAKAHFHRCASYTGERLCQPPITQPNLSALSTRES